MFDFAKFKSYSDFADAFPTEEACYTYLESIRWKDGNVVSPYEPSSTVYTCANNKYKCRTTGKYFTVRTGTIFESSKVSLRTWFQAIFYCVNTTNGISSYGLVRFIGKTQKTCWLLQCKIRYMMDHKIFARKFEDSIEIDESYFGGKNENRHKSKKVPHAQGRSTKDKEVIMGIFQNEISYKVDRPNKNNPARTVKEKVILQPAIVRTYVVPDVKTLTLLPIILDKVKPGSTITTDENGSYKRLHVLYSHELVRHSMKQYVNQNGYTTNRIEGYWSHFKRTWGTTYRGRITAKHLHRYCREQEFRFNTRHLKIGERFDLLVRGLKKRLRFKDLKNNK